MSLRAALCAVLILVLFSSLTLTAQESSWTVAAAPYMVDTDQNLLNAEMKKTVQAFNRRYSTARIVEALGFSRALTPSR